MNLLISRRVFNDKIVSLFRNISSSRATFATETNIENVENVENVQNIQNVQNVQNIQNVQNVQNVQDTQESDEPIEMENPYVKEKKLCLLCEHKIKLDYKNVRLLSQFQSRFTGRIYGRHITGLCKAQQEILEREVSKAQIAGLMGYMNKDPKYWNDPQLFKVNVFLPPKP